MRASLDTNVIIHLYRANLQNILFEFFTGGVFIYEQIRSVELQHHGQAVIAKVDADILILRYLFGTVDEYQTVTDFNAVNEASNLNWSLASQLAKFIKRFFKNPYKHVEREWIVKWSAENKIDIIAKLKALNRIL